MTTPAKPEQKDPKVGVSNPAGALWDSQKPYVGPPENGQPRKGSASKDPPTAPVITGNPEKR